jgi:LysR family carnitine catabolism transcriptional activator
MSPAPRFACKNIIINAMRTRLTIQELEAFLEVAETLSFRQSAERCFVSQPALSRTIASAETKLNARLFDRNTRRVQITSAGLELLPVAKRIVFELRDSLGYVSEFVAGRAGRFTIATVPAVAASILPARMQAFLQSYPNVSITLQSVDASEVLNMVAQGDAHLGVCSLPHDETGGVIKTLEFTPLVRDELILICSDQDELAHEKSVSWDVFARRPYIANGPASSLRPLVQRALADNKIVVTPRYESMNLCVTAAMVAAGLGIAVMPTLARRLINPGGLAFLPLVDPIVTRDIGIVTRSGRSLPGAAQQFKAALLEHRIVSF